MIRRYCNLSVALVLGALLLWGCGESDEQRRQRTKAEQEQLEAARQQALKIAVMPTMDCLPLYLLADSVLYDTTKVDIRLLRYNAQMDCDTALLRRHVEGTVTDLVRAERMRRTGHPVACVTATDAQWQLYANKHARLKELSQLSDRLIAMTRYSATDLLTDRATKRGKLKYPAYKVQINDVGVRLQMLLNNELDAFWFMEPQATAARQAGANVLMDTRKDSLTLGAIAFRVDVMADDRRYNQIQALLQAYDQAVEHINRNGLAAYAPLIRKYMGVDDAVIEALPPLRFNPHRDPLPKDIAAAASF